MTDVAELQFIPGGESLVRNPYPVYDKMRATGRILETPYGVVIVHRYEDVRQVHLDHEAFSMGALMPAMGMSGEGGVMGGAWLTGGLEAIARTTGWDPASAEYVVGTSAGSRSR